jgi:hypothetical protein
MPLTGSLVLALDWAFLRTCISCPETLIASASLSGGNSLGHCLFRRIVLHLVRLLALGGWGSGTLVQSPNLSDLTGASTLP